LVVVTRTEASRVPPSSPTRRSSDLAMLNSLLDISRLSVGMVRPQLRHINLHGWLARLTGTLEKAASEKGIRLELQCPPRCAVQRSEEHTSELQSRENLVCRLLLEKK